MISTQTTNTTMLTSSTMTSLRASSSSLSPPPSPHWCIIASSDNRTLPGARPRQPVYRRHPRRPRRNSPKKGRLCRGACRISVLFFFSLQYFSLLFSGSFLFLLPLPLSFCGVIFAGHIEEGKRECVREEGCCIIDVEQSGSGEDENFL